MNETALQDFSWDAVETVLLDMDGTLLDKYFDDYFWERLLPEEYARRYRLDIREARHKLLSRYKQEEGKLTWTDLDYWSKEFDIDIPALKEQIHHLIAVHPHVEEFLQFLQKGDKRIHLVTNAHYKTLDLKLKKTEIGKYFDSVVCAFDIGLPKEDNAFWEKAAKVIRFNKKTEIGKYFDSVVCAFDIGLPKEDNAFWEKAAKVIRFNKETTMLVDDTENVLLSARAYGIRYLILKARPSSRGELRTSEQFPAISYFKELLKND